MRASHFPVLGRTPPAIIVVCWLLCAGYGCRQNSAPIATAARASLPAPAPAPPPNFVFILADDLGWGDLGSYGQTQIRTPRLDALAAEGARFTQFYAGSTVCAPSRAVLMAGLHTGHARVRGNDANAGARMGDGVPLEPSDTTLATYLRRAGYRTGAFGKWGLGVAGTTGSPERQGFEQFYGYLNQAHAHRHRTPSLVRVRDGGPAETVPVDSTAHTQGPIVDAALDFVRASAREPFLLYLPLTAPHADLDPDSADLRAYLTDGRSVFAPETPFPGNSYRAQANPKAAYAALVTGLDREVGRVLDLLDSLGLRQNTYVFFTSDNGPHAEGGHDPDAAFDSNGPWRGYKRDLTEGGIRVPLIVSGPGVAAGQVVDAPAGFQDVLPTFLRLAGAAPAARTDGTDISGVWARVGTGSAAALARARPYLYWEHEITWQQLRQQALLEAATQLKLVRLQQGDGPVETFLYDLRADPGETNNLAQARPRDLARLSAAARAETSRPSVASFFDAGAVFGG